MEMNGNHSNGIDSMNKMKTSLISSLCSSTSSKVGKTKHLREREFLITRKYAFVCIEEIDDDDGN